MTRKQVVLFALVFQAASAVEAGDVIGRVRMPDTCSPAVSPAVVKLVPKDAVVPAAPAGQGMMTLIDQKGLRFVPRVRPLSLGQTLKFTNQDPETHNVHVLGTPFNQSMAPGQDLDFVPDKAGVYKVVCDVHTHMRAFVIVGEGPWIAACDREGAFLIPDVPAGHYVLDIWHEFGEPLRREIDVAGDELDLGTIELAGPSASGPSSTLVSLAWPEVNDRVSTQFAAAFDAVGRPEGRKRARRLAEDAYYVEFEASGMEAAVARYLGLERLAGLEHRFRDLIKEVGRLPEGQRPGANLHEGLGVLLLDLNKAADQLNRLGITDRTKLEAPIKAAIGNEVGSPSPDDRHARLAALRRAFDGVRQLADHGEPDDAASALSDAYFDAFEPLERPIMASEPATVPRLEARLNALRGKVGAGLKGGALKAEFDDLHAEVARAIDRVAADSAGAFGTAFLASLFTIVREGVEVILIITMLLALVDKAGRGEARGAIRWGLGLGAAASVATAVALNLLVSSARGRAGEVLEGAVMLTAAAMLFYVSYWLISQSQARRWADFLKRHVSQGAMRGSLITLGLTAFLAIYREGAETALMYQAMLGFHASKLGTLGLLSGMVVGAIALAIFYFVVRRASGRLPLRPFFAVTGSILFAMSVIFAGKGVFELQQARILRVTPLEWLGNGLPIVGLYPNVQVVAMQGLLVIGALLAAVLLAVEVLRPRPTTEASRTSRPTASVGA
jgi:high-affinity iron transporter